MDDARKDISGPAPAEKTEPKIWQTPRLSVEVVADLTLGAPAYLADGIDGS